MPQGEFVLELDELGAHSGQLGRGHAGVEDGGCFFDNEGPFESGLPANFFCMFFTDNQDSLPLHCDVKLLT